MKYAFFVSLCIALFSCSKNGVLVDPPMPVTNNLDSARMMYITTHANGSTSFTFSAFRLDGSLGWQKSGLRTIPVWSTPAYRNDVVYLVSGNTLSSIDNNSGAVNWSYTELNSPLLTNARLFTDTVALASTSKNYSPSNRLLLFKSSSNVPFWQMPISEQPLVAPLLDGNTIYCLTTNSMQTLHTLHAYDVLTKSIKWQKLVAHSPVTDIPTDILLQGDTLVIGAGTHRMSVLNKNSGNLIWSQALTTFDRPYIYNNTIVYEDPSYLQFTIRSMKTGSIILQGEAIPRTINHGKSYISDNKFINYVADTVYCSNIHNGSLLWKKAVVQRDISKFVVVGNTLFGANVSHTIGQPSKIIILNASDFTIKDSIIVSDLYFDNLSVLSKEGKIY